MVFSFNNKNELAEILGIIERFEYSKRSQLTQQQRENRDGSEIDEFWFFFLFRLCTNQLYVGLSLSSVTGFAHPEKIREP